MTQFRFSSSLQDLLNLKLKQNEKMVQKKNLHNLFESLVVGLTEQVKELKMIRMCLYHLVQSVIW